MRPESSWFSPLVWLAMLGLAFVCGLIVMGQAFETRVLLLDDHALRVSADYSADPLIVRVAQIPPVNSAVISDTVRDLIAEQVQAPLLGMLLAEPTVLAAPTTRTPTLSLARRPSPTATLASIVQVASTALPAPSSSPVEVGFQPGQPTLASQPHTSRTALPSASTALPTRTSAPPPTATPRLASTARPTARPTLVPTVVPTAVPTAVPTHTPTAVPTHTPTDIPTATPTDIPTETPTDIPTETPTDIPTATPTDIPTETPTDIPTETPTLGIAPPLDLITPLLDNGQIAESTPSPAPRTPSPADATP